MFNLTNPIFTDADKAREYLENLYWPNGPVCRHCGNADAARLHRLEGKSTRPGLFWCNECDKPFTVTVGTIMEDSHLPLNKWVLAFYLMNSSKKGMSAHQIHRTLGISYKTAWFMCHRIREAMTEIDPNANGGPLGGKDKVVEVDETIVGGRSKNRAYRDPAPKKSVVTLVERGGRARSKHIANIDAEHLRPFVVKNASRKSTLNTDEASYYVKMGRVSLRITRPLIIHAANMRTRTAGAPSRRTAPRTISAFSSVEFMVSITQSARLTCIATLPSSISAIQTAPSSALKTRSALRSR